jgi:WD40 repeat protein
MIMLRRLLTSTSALLLYLLGQPAIAQPPVLVPQTGHSAAINSVAFSPNGKLLASGGDDTRIILWDVDSGIQLRSIAGFATRIDSTVFDPKGKTIAVSSIDGSVGVWEVESGRKLYSIAARCHKLLEFNPISYSPNGETLAYVGYGESLKKEPPKKPDKSSKIPLWETRCDEKANLKTAIYFFNLRTGETRSFVPLGSNTWTDLPIAFSPDNRILASGKGHVLTLWDITTGNEIRSFKFGQSNNKLIDYIASLAFSADGSMLVASYRDTVKVIDVFRRKEVDSLKGPYSLAKFVSFSPDGQSFGSGGNTLAFSPDGKTIATDGRGSYVKLWNATSRKELNRPEGKFSEGAVNINRTPVGEGITAYSFSSPDKVLATGGDNTAIRVWDVATRKLLRTLTGAASPIRAVAFSHNGDLLGIAGSNNVIKLWDVKTGQFLRSLTIVSTGDGETTASNILEVTNFTVKHMELKDKLSPDDPLRRILGPSTWHIGFSLDDKFLVAGGEDQVVRVWDVTTGKRIHALLGHTDIISSVAFSADGEIVASASLDKTIRLWSATTGRLLHILTDKVTQAEISKSAKVSWDEQKKKLQEPIGGITCIAFSPDSKTLVSGDRNRMIRLWDVKTGQQLQELAGSSEAVYYVDFSLDGKQLISAATDESISEWDLSTGQRKRLIKGQVGDNKRTSLRPDGKVLAIAGENGRISFLSTNDNHLLYYLIPLRGSDSLTITPDGLFDGTEGAWKQIIWRSAEQTTEFLPVEAFFNEFYYPELMTDIMAGKRPLALRNIADLDRRQPQIQLTSDAPHNVTDVRNLNVEVQVKETPSDEKRWRTGSGAQDVRLFRNGSLVKVWHDNVLNGQATVTLKATIPIVAGENRFTAYAFNRDNIKSSDATLTIMGSDSLKRRGVAYLLAVGVNEYANSQYNLRYAVADAREFSQQFKQAQAKLDNYEHIELTLLNNQDATKANILKSLTDLSARLKPEDAVVMFFAGHGTAQKNRFYLIPHDLGYDGSRTQLDSVGLQSILSHSISDEELERALEGVEAGQMLLVIDACNSGQALEAEEKRRGPMNSKGLAQLAYEKGMYILTAAQSYQTALEAERLGHGFLTFALVEEGLKTNTADREPKDGQLLLREWLNYAVERVPQIYQEERERQNKQDRQLERIKPAQTDARDENPIQRPRVFYRREAEQHPLVVARP